MVFLAEGHLALGRLEAHALHGLDELVGVGVAVRGLEGRDQRHGRAEAAGREEVWRGLELLVVRGHHGFVHGVLGDAEVVVRGAFHAGEVLVRSHGGQDVAAGGDLDAIALEVHVSDLERVACTGPDDEDDLAAGHVLELVDQALGTGGEVGGGGGQVFLVHQLGVLERVLEGLHAIAAEGIVLRQRRHRHARLVDGHGVGDGVLAAVAAGAEDVLVPLVAGDGVGHGGLHQQDLLVFLGHGQQGQGHAAGGGADGDVGLVVRVGRGQQALAQVRLALVVLLDHDELLAIDGHAAAGGVVQAHHQAGLGLLAIGLQRTRLAVHVGNADFTGLRERGGRKCGGGNGCGSEGDQSATLHGDVSCCDASLLHSLCQHPSA